MSTTIVNTLSSLDYSFTLHSCSLHSLGVRAWEMVLADVVDKCDGLLVVSSEERSVQDWDVMSWFSYAGKPIQTLQINYEGVVIT